MRTTTLKSVLIKLITVLGVSFTALNSAHAALQFNVPVTASNINSYSGAVVGQRTAVLCNISANGVLMRPSSVLAAFICQLKMLGATDLGTMTIDTAIPGFVGGYYYTSAAGRIRTNQPPNKVRVIAAFYYPNKPANQLETYLGTTFTSTGNNAVAAGGILMHSPDEAVVAATAAFQNRTINIGYWPGNNSYYYLDPSVCGFFSGIFAGYSINQLAFIGIVD